MSETEYGRLAAKLDKISDKVVAIDEKLAGYGDLIQQANRHDLAIQRIDDRCKGIQEDKKVKSVPWGNVKSGVIVGLVVGIIMLTINLIIAYAK